MLFNNARVKARRPGLFWLKLLCTCSGFDLKFLWAWFNYTQHLKFWWYCMSISSISGSHLILEVLPAIQCSSMVMSCKDLSYSNMLWWHDIVTQMWCSLAMIDADSICTHWPCMSSGENMFSCSFPLLYVTHLYIYSWGQRRNGSPA